MRVSHLEPPGGLITPALLAAICSVYAAALASGAALLWWVLA